MSYEPYFVMRTESNILSECAGQFIMTNENRLWQGQVSMSMDHNFMRSSICRIKSDSLDSAPGPRYRVYLPFIVRCL